MMAHNDRMNSHIRKRLLYESRSQTPESSHLRDDIDQIQQQLFGDWDFAQAHENNQTLLTPDILRGPRGEIPRIETLPFHMTTLSRADAIARGATSQQEQHTTDTAIMSWLAGLDVLLDKPRRREAESQPATFGLEFEFLIPVERRYFPREPPDPGRYFIPLEEYRTFGVPPTFPAQIYIAEVLNNAQLFAVSILDKYDEKDPMLHHRLTSDYYSVWRVRSDSTVHPDAARLFRKWQFLGLEINSPKLLADESGFLEVKKVLELMRKNVRMSLSTSCGLHVHVDASALTFAERQHFLCLYLMIEDVLFSFCAAHRRSSTWCLPTSRYSYLADWARDNYQRLSLVHRVQPLKPRGQSVSVEAYEQHYIIQRMWTTRNMRRLLDQAARRSGTRTALAIKNVGRESEDEDKWTFEFRHFQGTLDPEVAKQWTRMCVGLVLAAKGLGEYGKPLADMAYNKFYSMGRQQDKAEARRELLQFLGMEDAVDFWKGQVLAYQAHDGWLQKELGPDGFAPVFVER